MTGGGSAGVWTGARFMPRERTESVTGGIMPEKYVARKSSVKPEFHTLPKHRRMKFEAGSAARVNPA